MNEALKKIQKMTRNEYEKNQSRSFFWRTFN